MKNTTIALSMILGLAAISLPSQASAGNNGIFSQHVDTYYGDRHFREHRHKRKFKEYKPVHIKPLPPRRIARKLRKRGFSDIHAMRFNGRFYKLRAYNRRGMLVRLKVNAYNGKVVKRKLVRHRHPVNIGIYGLQHKQIRNWDHGPVRYPFWMQ